MKHRTFSRSRRRLLQAMASLAMPLSISPWSLALPADKKLLRRIPASGEMIPAVGMGSWLTFGIDPDNLAARNVRVEILRTFFAMGGELIDSSPMYGTAEKIIGYGLKQIENDQNLFSATKVWTHGWRAGIRQMERSRLLWGVERFDLMQIHNLLDWQTHLATLRGWKDEGKIRYLGITTSHGRRHEELERIMRNEPLDFVQFTYNMLDREAEQILLPLAAERGIAVIINRPFQRGGLFDAFQHQPLPEWTTEIDCDNWAQFFLKFIISHPAVTCAIPATSRVAHMRENMGACYGRVPDAAMRRRMLRYVESL